ncbi:MAG: sigma-70 family RNA polymerase sigma factor [Archangiaceae bacterium]|nr:sigma-70 family RNA polymerase sigma factor [Archangiaceae bacterium]
MKADADRLTELYRRYAPALFRRALSLLGSDEAEAHDVVQDVFAAYIKNESKLRGEAAPFTVLYQMTTFQTVDRLRRRSRWSGRVSSLSVDEEGDGPALQVAAPDDVSARLEAARDVALLTHGEDEQTLTCAVLYFVEGYTTQEIADSLDISRKTVGRALAAFAERAQKRADRFGVEKGVA